MICLRWFTFTLLMFLTAPFTLGQTVIHDANITFTTIDVPGAEVTNIYGINSAGDMVGTYVEPGNSQSRGFLYSNGNFTLFDYPGGNDTVPIGINDSGIISGSAYVRNFTAIVSFLYDGTTFTTIRQPGKTVTDAHGINNAGVIVGGDGTVGATKGFVRVGTRFKNISPPGNYIFIFANTINNLGQIVGTADDTGFFYSHGQFKTLAVPGATMTQPWGINDNGIVVGWDQICSPCALHGFVLMNGKYRSLNYPGALATFALGISASGQVVGSYELDDMTYHGFVTSPLTATASDF